MESDVPESDSAWARQHWSPGGGDALLFYVIYGDIDVSAELDRRKYRTRGIPDGLDLRRLQRSDDGAYLESSFEAGHPWDQLLDSDPALAREVKQAAQCLILQGQVPDPPSLDYLRDAIGLITFFLDHGGVAVFDIQVMRWWTPAAWRREIFEPDDPNPGQHVIILYSDDDDAGVGTWFHTRGMRKFGRPDISVRDVPPQQFVAVRELCDRFIAHQASGGLVPEGRTVRMAGLERLGVVHHGGDHDDDDFNNVHFEVVWQGGA